MLFEFIRKLACPFDEIEKYVPTKGKILDVGCGHGIFSRYLAQRSPLRHVVGIDPSFHKFKLATRSHPNLQNLEFRNKYLWELAEEKYDGICIIDVMYLLPHEEKRKLLLEAKKRLKKDGLLILTEVDTDSKLLSSLLALQETFMVHILHYTFSDYRQLYFLSKQDYLKMLSRSGFKIIEEGLFRSFLPYSHRLLIVRST